MRILWGIIIAAIGIFFVLRTDTIMRINGRIQWAELHLGTAGGTRLLYKLIGIALIALGFMLITNLAGDFFLWVFGPIFRIGF